jgi:hypothetical protein
MVRKVNKQEKKIIKQETKQVLKNVKKGVKNMRVNNNPVNKLIEDIALSIACPGMAPTYRWSSEFSAKKSATANPFAITQADFGQTGGTTPQMSTAEFAVFQFRDCERASVQYLQNSAGAAKQYQCVFKGSIGQIPSIANPVNLGPTLQPVAIVYATSLNLYSPHGPTLYAGIAKGSDRRFIWCDSGDTLVVNVTVASAVTVQTAVDYYGSNGLFADYNIVDNAFVGAGTASITVKTAAMPGGYYGLGIAAPLVADYGSVTINSIIIAGSGSCWAHQPIPGFEYNVESVQGARIIGASTMFTNTAAMLNLGGQCAMYQSAESEEWQSYAITNLYSVLAGLNDSKAFNMANGIYGFLKPTQTEDFDYKCHLTINNGLVVDSFYPVDNSGSFLVMVANCPSAAGCIGYVTLRDSVEYLTLDVWRETKYAEVNSVVYSRALETLKMLPQFHENPLHLSDLWSGIKSVVSDIGRGFIDYGIPIAQTAMTIAKMF